MTAPGARARKTETSDDLQRRIAEALGWRIHKIYDGSIGDPTKYYAVFAPDGTPQLRETAYSTENEWPEWEVMEALPDWANDANAALALLPVHEMLCELYAEHFIDEFGDDIVWFCVIGKHEHDDHHFMNHGNATPAEAICRAWLAWRESERGAEAEANHD